ncbi:3'-5' exonuclease [Vibrio cincinnatiensis]|uniref:3'-5' exonuclease n=1 Tax=Vibrio cincinnatiensis TaxID=675 RepID=UPI001302A95E|nr:3'-5' exonuclease [Vibrio cincinnatiensis]
MKPLDLDDAVIFDTETTGLDNNARIVEISVIDAKTGFVLFNSLVNPLCSIPAAASSIHGIVDSDVMFSPTFDKVWNEIKGIFFDRTVIAYNFDFDFRMIAQSLSDFDYPEHNLLAFFSYSFCAMHWYAEFYGAVNSHGSFAWQRLTAACEQQNIDVSGLKAHRSLSDCEMTRRLIHAVNAKLGA